MADCACSPCLVEENQRLQKRVEVLEAALEEIEREGRCCAHMTYDVPSDSVQARIPYCRYHGRTRRVVAFIAHEALTGKSS